MSNNVKFTICEFDTDETFGIQALVEVTENLEGYLEEVTDRILGQISGPSVSQKMPGEYKLAFTPNQIFVAATNEYTDFYEDVVNGKLIKFTAYKHPKLRIWMEYPVVTKVYLITAIRDADANGRHKVVTLKEHEN